MERKQWNNEKLLERIENMHINKSQLAREFGYSPQAMNKKIHGMRKFTVPEAYIMCKRLNIPLEDMLIFFSEL